MDKSNLRFCLQMQEGQEDRMHLRRLQELSKFFSPPPLLSAGFPGGSEDKASACSVGDLGSIPWLGRSPGEVNGDLLQLFLPGESHGQRCLVGYSPQGHKESDMTEQIHFTYICTEFFDAYGNSRFHIKL